MEKSDDKVNTSEKVAFTKYGTGEFCSYTEYYSESQKNESWEIYSFNRYFAEEDNDNC